MWPKSPRFAGNILKWLAAWSLVLMAAAAENTTSPALEPIRNETASSPGYTWSPWGRWSPCSKTCGGGISVQKRSCVLRNITAEPLPSIPDRASAECTGFSQRYHECNTAPCPGEQQDARAEQCSSYDRRPFRGRFYNWVPYVDGDSPCTLNCRPMGHQFYASLGLVADGTPCTKPGYRAVCVQGTCKVVGREAVLAGGGGEARCGRRLVSGLFARPRLPLGYSYVTTVPRGACRLNVSEMVPSDNYIALKVANGSYIMNGEFAVSAPGSYDAVGARFQYNRIGALDSVFAYGPLQQSIDIMILYTQPNPNIKYEYLVESLQGDIEIESQTEENPTTPAVETKHMRRHHNLRVHFNNQFEMVTRYPDYSASREDASFNIEDNFVKSRTFVWKILNYTPCSRSCGGGFQLGKFKCVETSSNSQDREVSPVHCTGSPPSGRRRRCGTGQCQPRWRTTPWSSCPKCGPAERSRIVGCVQDHSKGIAKVSDQKCPAPKPLSKDMCDIPDCNSSFDQKQVIVKQTKRRDEVDSFQDGPVYTVVQSVNGTEEEIGPEYSFNSAGGWLYTEWSECVGWCVGGALQTRGVLCGDPAGCAPRRAPDSSRSCTAQLTCEPFDGQWFTGDWSVCSSPCGGRQVRGVLCVGGSGRHLKDSACKAPKPEVERECGEECGATWYLSDWGQCQGSCEQPAGTQRRTVYCARPDNVPVLDADCSTPRPQSKRVCSLERCVKSGGSSGVGLESQRIARNEIVLTPITITGPTIDSFPKDCVDKLSNCAMAVQARLCHYNYYIQNCCSSCRK